MWTLHVFLTCEPKGHIISLNQTYDQWTVIDHRITERIKSWCSDLRPRQSRGSLSAWSMVVHWAPSLLAPKLLMFCLKLKNLPEMALIRYKTQTILEQFVVHTRIKKVISKEIPHCWLCVSYLQMYVNLLFWYQFFCGFSGSVMTNSWVLILFNLIFTSAPPLIYGILNQDLPADTLMELPELYQDAQTSKVTANMPQKHTQTLQKAVAV